MPVDVIAVDSEAGDRRVPGGRLACFDMVFLLNEDMVDSRVETSLYQVLFNPRESTVFDVRQRTERTERDSL